MKISQNNDSIMCEIQNVKYSSGGNLTADFQEAVIRALEVDHFELFAITERPKDSPVLSWASIIGLHNRIDMFCGGSRNFAGHMSPPVVAAFDPIFWLHHGKLRV